MPRIRKALPSFGALVALVVAHFTGASADLVAMGASGAAVLDALVSTDRSRDVVLADVYALRRAQAYQTFGAAIGGVHQSAGVVMTYKLHLVDYLHGATVVIWAQRNFEEQYRNVLAALSDIFLYGSSETQETAKNAFLVLGEQLKRMGGTKQGSPQARQVFDEISPVLGDAVVVGDAPLKLTSGSPSPSRSSSDSPAATLTLRAGLAAAPFPVEMIGHSQSSATRWARSAAQAKKRSSVAATARHDRRGRSCRRVPALAPLRSAASAHRLRP